MVYAQYTSAVLHWLKLSLSHPDSGGVDIAPQFLKIRVSKNLRPCFKTTTLSLDTNLLSKVSPRNKLNTCAKSTIQGVIRVWQNLVAKCYTVFLISHDSWSL